MPPDIEIDGALFKALLEVDLNQLNGRDLSCILPFLTNLLLSSSFVDKPKLFRLLYPNKKTNYLIKLLSSKSSDIVEHVRPAYLFEASSWPERTKLVMSEFLRIHSVTTSTQTPETKLTPSELLDNAMYVEDISYCLYSLLLKPPSIPVINLIDMAEALLHVKHGITYIIRLVANMPDRCFELCSTLISRGEANDEGANLNDVSEQRAKTLRELCILCPSIAFSVRSATLQTCKMPSLTMMITSDYLSQPLLKYQIALENENSCHDDSSLLFDELKDCYDNAIAFITGILLGADEAARVWFAQYTKTAQQKRIDQSHNSMLTVVRSQLITYMKHLFKYILLQDPTNLDSPSSKKADNKDLIMATATLRLFCSLKGIGSLKLNHEESDILLKLVTSRPPVNQTSVNFVTTGVCTLLVCPPPNNNQKDDKRAIDWLRWLIKDSEFTKSQHSSHGKCSITELLRFFAAHFQSNQTSQIADLVCSTLGMKLQIKASVSKCKHLFVQDFFSDLLDQDAKLQEESATIGNPITEFKPVQSALQLCRMPSLTMMITTDYLSIPLDKPDTISTDGSVSDNHLADLTQVIENVSQIVRGEVDDRKFVKESTNSWWKFNSILPRKLWLQTVNALDVKQVGYSWEELVSDPLIVLRCNLKVFRCVDLLNIVLHILGAFLAASRRSLQDQISETPRQKDTRNLEELRVTLIHAQTSAAIQILLESCIPSDSEEEALIRREKKLKLDPLDEELLKKYDSSVDCICEHLHQVFIADTNLAKLVHFQTYPSELLAITSDKIPSLHICLDYIPELLAQQDLSKQVFVIELASHLCKKYAITKSLNVAKLCFNVAYTLLQLLPSQRRALFFIPVLPALHRICKVFPILREDMDIILAQINQITLAHMASTSSRLSLGSARPFEGLDELSWRETTNVMMRTLNVDEALYLCIQKCQAESTRLKSNDACGMFIDRLQKQNNSQPVYNSIFAYGNHVMNPSGI